MNPTLGFSIKSHVATLIHIDSIFKFDVRLINLFTLLVYLKQIFCICPQLVEVMLSSLTCNSDELSVMAFLPDRTGSVDGVGVADLVVITSAWLFCSSESGEDSRKVEEAVLSTEEEVDGGRTVTVAEDPDEEEDLGRGCAEVEAKAEAEAEDEDEGGAGLGAEVESEAGGVEWTEVADSTSMGPSAPRDSCEGLPEAAAAPGVWAATTVEENTPGCF